MKFILCYNNIVFICNLKTQARKYIILSNTINGYNIETTWECRPFKCWRGSEQFFERKKGKQLGEKRPNPSSTLIFKFFVAKDPF